MKQARAAPSLGFSGGGMATPASPTAGQADTTRAQTSPTKRGAAGARAQQGARLAQTMPASMGAAQSEMRDLNETQKFEYQCRECGALASLESPTDSQPDAATQAEAVATASAEEKAEANATSAAQAATQAEAKATADVAAADKAEAKAETLAAAAAEEGASDEVKAAARQAAVEATAVRAKATASLSASDEVTVMARQAAVQATGARATATATRARTQQGAVRQVPTQAATALQRRLLTSPASESPASRDGSSWPSSPGALAGSPHARNRELVQSASGSYPAAGARQAMQSAPGRGQGQYPAQGSASPHRGGPVSPDSGKKSKSRSRTGQSMSQTMSSFHTAGSSSSGSLHLPAAAQTWHSGGFPGVGQPGHKDPGLQGIEGHHTGPRGPEPYIVHVWEQHPHGEKEAIRKELIDLGAMTPPGTARAG